MEPAALHAPGQPGKVPPVVHLSAHPGHGAEAASTPRVSGHPSPTGTSLEQATLLWESQAATRCSIPAPSPELLASSPWLGLGLRGCFPVQDAHLEPIRHL